MPTTVIKSNEFFYDLVTEDSKAISVSFSPSCSNCNVYIRRNGRPDTLPLGRIFHGSSRQEQLNEAIETYKDQKIKAALRALLCELL